VATRSPLSSSTEYNGSATAAPQDTRQPVKQQQLYRGAAKNRQNSKNQGKVLRTEVRQAYAEEGGIKAARYQVRIAAAAWAEERSQRPGISYRRKATHVTGRRLMKETAAQRNRDKCNIVPNGHNRAEERRYNVATYQQVKKNNPWHQAETEHGTMGKEGKACN
jgi:hypothetical protein